MTKRAGSHDRCKAQVAEKKERQRLRQEQHDEAVAFCRKEGCRGKAALSRNKGRWPDITWQTVNLRLDGKVKLGQ